MTLNNNLILIYTVLSLFLLIYTNGFIISPIPTTQLIRTTSTFFFSSSSSSSLYQFITPSNRYYQLEEMEDSEYCTTELYLSSDGTVRLTGTTNGPLPSASTGQWTVTEEDGVFEMRVERKFRMGFGIGDGNGESFTVARVFRGEVDRVGGMIAVTGSMFIPDDTMEDAKCGIFGMIETTDSKFGQGNMENSQHV